MKQYLNSRPFTQDLILQINICHYISFALACTYALVLAALPIEEFKDRSNYLIYADNSMIFLVKYFKDNILTFLFNEPLWLFINFALRTFLPSESVLRLIIFFPAFLFSFSLIRSNYKNLVWIILILLLPQVLKNHIMQLRQGFAIGIFIFTWFMLVGKKRLFGFLLTPFIHSSFFVILVLLFTNHLLSRMKFSIGIKNFVILIGGALSSMLLTQVATILGSRQGARYADAIPNVSGMAFLFWAAVFILFILQGKAWLKHNSFCIITLVFYLSSYFFLPLSARIFESIITLIFISGLCLKNYYKFLYLIFFLFYFIYQYYLRMSKPFLGFGI